MRMQALGPGAGWSWLRSGFTVAARNPGKILGAAALMTICLAIVPTIQFVTNRHGGSVALVVMGLGTVVAGIIMPILYGGAMRLLDADRNGRPFSALTVFDPFRPGHGGARLALFAVCILIAYLVFFAIVLSTVGHGMIAWYLDVLAQQAAGAPPVAPPHPPAGSGITFILTIVFFLFYSGTLAVGTGQVALRGQSPWDGFRDGVAGAFKNALPIVVLALCALVALIVATIALGILVAIFFLLGHVVGNSISVALTGLTYVVFAWLLTAFMMGVNYAMWHDVAAGATDRPADASVPSAQA